MASSQATDEAKTRICYTEEEKAILKQLIKSNPIIWSKQSDKGTVRRKQNAWNNVAVQFSATPGCSTRTAKQLLKLWNNMKTKYRGEITLQKKHAMGTGGGEQLRSPDPDPLMETMADTLDIELRNTRDSDERFLQKNQNSSMTSQTFDLTLNTPPLRLPASNYNIVASTSRTRDSDERFLQKNQNSSMTSQTFDLTLNTPPLPLPASSNNMVASTSRHLDNIEIINQNTNVSDGEDDGNPYDHLIEEDEIQEVNIERQMTQGGAEDDELSVRKRKKPEMTYSDLLLIKKKEMEETKQVRLNILQSKLDAYRMKAEYYKFKMENNRNNTCHFSITLKSTIHSTTNLPAFSTSYNISGDVSNIY